MFCGGRGRKRKKTIRQTLATSVAYIAILEIRQLYFPTATERGEKRKAAL